MKIRWERRNQQIWIPGKVLWKLRKLRLKQEWIQTCRIDRALTGLEVQWAVYYHQNLKGKSHRQTLSCFKTEGMWLKQIVLIELHQTS